MLPFGGGQEMSVAALTAQIREAAQAGTGVEGITLLGGEPFAQAAAAAALARDARAAGLTVMVFTGFALQALRQRAASRQGEDTSADTSGIAALIDAADLIVDGPYLRDQPESRRRWIGSRNQVMHFLTDAYDPADPQFVAANTVEIRLGASGLVVNGWPAGAADVLAALTADAADAEEPT
jgi:anaerobic ribonucleoside-triphosphate reductase activating protein